MTTTKENIGRAMSCGAYQRQDFSSGVAQPSVRFSLPQLDAYTAQAIADHESAKGAVLPFGSKREAALALYKPPFSFNCGYIHDGASRMVADQDGRGSEVEKSIALRVRGWGRIGYLPDAAALQDEVGAVIAQALSEFWERQASQAGTQGVDHG